MADLLHGEEFDEDEVGSRLGLWITIVLVLLLLGLVGAGFYLFQMLRAEQAGLGGKLGKEGMRVIEVTKQITNLQKEVATLHTQVATLDKKLSVRDEHWEKMLAEQTKVFDEKLEALKKQLELSHSKLANKIQAVQNQFNKTQADVLIADAEYLLGVANQNLRLVGDVKSALAALQAADQLLRQSGDPAVYKVRQALAKEIESLKAVQAPDIVGISAKLVTLQDKVESLPLALPHMGKVATSKKKSAEQTHETDKGLLESWKEVLTIRRRKTDRPVEAILTPEEVEAIRHALILKLETTRFAAVRGQQDLYKHSLESAKQWVKRHFDTRSQAVKDYLAQLDSLANAPVSLQLPEIGRSLQLLQHLPALRLEQTSLSGNSANQ
ncbi:MAG: hypothetical protein AXA67_07200 [Methylothermaceae bacteria B42]|nr:MAG: hypothetical protein AXA67_07200 [Methylothermaceae bacteria B42]HHJ40188.1 enzyme of heme biosynthesis [Methylothermaceae bacterium]